MSRIAIDNGHGRFTNGKRTPPFPLTNKVIHEWEFNHATAKKLENILISQGHEVLMVSDTQIDTPLKTRTDKANQWSADLFISIHYNAFKGIWGSHGGIETLYKSEEGKKLSEFIQTQLIKTTGLRNRGVRLRNDLHVLNATDMVATLIECGFMDNLEEAELMLNEDYQTNCAKAIANGINQYLKYTPIVVKQTLYRVRKTWADTKSQIGAYTNFNLAKKLADNNVGYKVFDESGNIVYPIPPKKNKNIIHTKY